MFQRLILATSSLLLLLSSSYVSAVAPVVSLTAPVNNSTYGSTAWVNVAANATNVTGATITKVVFYRGASAIGTDTTAPYTNSWVNVPVGTHSVTAKATNSLGEVTTSAPITINVVANALPSVSLTAPTNNSSVAGKATIVLSANASDTGGTISKVQFYNGTTLLNSDTTAPYSYNWANVVPGTYTLTAKATDNLSGVTTSSPITFTVTNPISVSLTAPSNNSITAPGTPITISATATDSKATISKVDFYQGATLLNSDTTAPYSYSWTTAAVGSYSITAKVTDSQGLTLTSAPVAIQVKVATTPPTVSLTTPANNANFIAPASISLTANAAAIGSGNAISQVQYYQGTTLIATAATNTAPYSATWSNVTAGSYSLTAKATDTQGGTTSSSPVTITVINNSAPTVSMTANPANAAAPATIILNATATDSDGTIAKVEFFSTDTATSVTSAVAILTEAPYARNMVDVAAGSYSLTAKATDNLGAVTTSTPVAVNVTAHIAKAYDIQSDHLNTPRLITDNTGAVVWQWDSDPFGATVPNENPGNTGTANNFTFNPRFPGQYFDKETNLHYNYFRDYDSQIGRYVESDPIGLKGGINTYGYVGGNPVKYVDPKGLDAPPEFVDFLRKIFPNFQPSTNSGVVNWQLGLGAQAHVFALGGLVEGGFAGDNCGAQCGYVKVCTTVGPGLFFGAGGSAGGGIGNVSSGPSDTGGVIAVGAFGPGGGFSIDGNSDGVSGSTSIRPEWKGGFGGMAGVQSCRTYYVCKKK